MRLSRVALGISFLTAVACSRDGGVPTPLPQAGVDAATTHSTLDASEPIDSALVDSASTSGEALSHGGWLWTDASCASPSDCASGFCQLQSADAGFCRELMGCVGSVEICVRDSDCCPSPEGLPTFCLSHYCGTLAL